MSNKSEQPPKQNINQESSTKNSSNNDNKKSAPEYPPATPTDQRTNSMNFNECDSEYIEFDSNED